MKKIAICIATLMFLGGCATTQESPRAKLGMNITNYHQHLRWARYSEAAAFLAEADRAGFLGRHEELGDDYKVVDYEIKSIAMTGKDKAKSEVVIKWLREPNMVVNKDKVTEKWEKTEHSGWLLVEQKVKALN